MVILRDQLQLQQTCGSVELKQFRWSGSFRKDFGFNSCRQQSFLPFENLFNVIALEKIIILRGKCWKN